MKGGNSEGKMIGAKDVGDMLGVSESKAYGYIRDMNAELQRSGFMTVRGKIPLSYVEKRFFGFQEQGGGADG